jgi:hypothetical protein
MTAIIDSQESTNRACCFLSVGDVYWACVLNFLFSLVGFPQVFPLSPLFHLEISETFFSYLYFSSPHSASRFDSPTSRIFWKETEEDVDDPSIHCALTINRDIVLGGLKNQLLAIDCIEYCWIFLCDNVILFNHAAAKWMHRKKNLGRDVCGVSFCLDYERKEKERKE